MHFSDIRLYGDRPVDARQCIIKACEFFQRQGAPEIGLGHLWLKRDGLVIACQGFRVTAQVS